MLSNILPRSMRAPRNISNNSVEAADDSDEHANTTILKNQALETLHEVFPGGDVDEIRRLLDTTSEESRLYIVTEIMLKSRRRSLGPSARAVGVPLAPWEKFRPETYQRTVKKAFLLVDRTKEFRGLSKATIQAVLVENNFQYARCRETLSEIAAKSWRFSLTNFFRRSPRAPASPLDPGLHSTGCKELDDEIFELGRPAREAQIEADRAVAARLNEQEHAEASALLECECCFSEYPWEEMVACGGGGHFFCRSCLTRSVQESVFGQGKSLIPEKASVRCISSSAQPPCGEFVPADILRTALPDDVYYSLEDRTASDALEKSGLPLIRCPFCGYAEVDELQPYRVKWPAVALCGLAVLLAAWMLVLLPYGKQLLPLFLLAASTFPSAHRPRIEPVVRKIALRRRGALFRCERTRCRRESCITCGKEWAAFHKCYEKEEDAARIFVEKAMADAVKRTCPLCRVSFVKSDGCNKLTCPCGYIMCYICRADIRDVGYKHFCQHFRHVPGTACSECDACDLYANEDEAAAIRRAAKVAEEEYWSRFGGQRPAGLRLKGAAAGAVQKEMAVSYVMREWAEWAAESAVEFAIEWT